MGWEWQNSIESEATPNVLWDQAEEVSRAASQAVQHIAHTPPAPDAPSQPCDLFSTDRIYTDHWDTLCFNKIEIDCCQPVRVGRLFRRERWGTESQQAGVLRLFLLSAA